MGEQPLFTTSAHVFEIDPDTKKSWLPSSKQAVPVSFYCDPMRSHHRIISVDDTKVIINSSITQNMHFMKTSAKFGQWSDPRANTVYGLGFSSENDLNKFAEKFNETKATIGTKSTQQNSAIDTNGYNKDSTESKSEITSSSLNNSKILWRMEAELSNLKNRNEEISILLQNYRDDNEQLKSKIQRLEEQKNTLTTECNQKDKWNEKILNLEEQQNINLQTIERLQKELQGQEILEEENERLTSHCQDLIRENELLKKQIDSLTSNSDGELSDTKLLLKLKTLQGTLGNRIGDLQSIHTEISSLLNPQEYSC